ncbi:MAG: metallophosphoesterase [Myxococcota bacterium]
MRRHVPAVGALMCLAACSGSTPGGESESSTSSGGATVSSGGASSGGASSSSSGGAGASSSSSSSGGGSSTSRASSSSAAAASSSSGAAGSTASSSTSGGGDTEVRFVAMGDTGTGSDGQYAIAAQVKQKCDAEGCDFVILLGDNIYDSGVQDVQDPQWQEKFELPYQDINLPFYAVLGNHDYGGNGAGYEWSLGPVEVEYTQHSDKWNMPATHYTWAEGHVGFIALDTNSIMWANTNHGDQTEWIGPALAQLNTTWRIALGHHPYLSNGPHGNAGSYDGVPFVPVANGANVKEFFDEHICGAVDVYLCGHDHSRQWLQPAAGCALELVVSGAGAKTTEIEGDNPVHYQSDQKGFLYVVIQGNQFKGQFINEDGSVGFERTFTRQ